MKRRLAITSKPFFAGVGLFVLVASPLRAQSGAGKGYDHIPEGAYSIIAEVHAKPGKEDELRAATTPLVKLVRNNPKNLVYFFQVDREDPGHIIFYEVYATKADFEAHNNDSYVKAWFAKLPDLAEGGVKTLRMEVVHASEQ
jgi:quinol monooxygenase YgiN